MKSLGLNLQRSRALYVCGIAHFLLAIALIFLIFVDNRQLLGINLWIKPLKFALSIGIYCISWQLVLKFLPNTLLKRRFVNFTIFALTFEMVAITSQAARGELSHFNQAGLYNTMLYSAMGLVITSQTFFSLYIGILFFRVKPESLHPAMLWAIRLAVLISVIFALQGGLMGQRMTHTVGAADGGFGIPVLNWSRSAGDLRIAHFFGLHALQVVPIFALLFKVRRPVIVIVFGILYFCLVSFLFYYALLGRGI